MNAQTPPDAATARARLVRLLQGAYSGELAATYAYVGHGRSLRDPVEREEIRAIEVQEHDHRTRVGRILAALGAGPDARRERRFTRIGKTIGLLCRLGGWYVPMYGAGRLERGNIVEYEVAARLAQAAGRPEFVEDLLDMAEVEWDHEAYFRAKVLSHPLRHVLRVWSAPPPRAEIRASFLRERAATSAAFAAASLRG